ncbi:MAG: T9SS type A sorting domain-containing protein [Bacteroidales bacterium]|nr:T9SS type A sorting domain-containing protein [Bacteroidales bacterium]MBN2763206.1 T9SS type A sorting domain-containing protein [Bacteroidales bacterium]
MHNDNRYAYDASSVSPLSTWLLPDIMKGSSGLIIWNNKIWTQNDHTDLKIYAVDTFNINEYQSYSIPGLSHIDWEEISQDSDYLYIGDFGNNENGNRTDLKILRIEKNSVLAGSPLVDTIHFSYALQTDFSPTGANNTDFDCEAFIVTTDSIYLFTKEWLSQKTSLYAMPKLPGDYVVDYQATCDVQGLITGSTFLESKDLIVLCGYSLLVQPFLYLLYDFKDRQFFGGNKRKISVDLPFHQVEGIATQDGLNYTISNEEFVQSFISVSQKLHTIDLSAYLSDYLNPVPITRVKIQHSNMLIFPNPADNELFIEADTDASGKPYAIVDMTGRVVLKGLLDKKMIRVNIRYLNKGSYLLIINNTNQAIFKIIKI